MLAAVAVVLIAVRIALPFAIERYANDRLDQMEGYGGEIEDVDLCFIRGVYSVEGIRILKTDGEVPVPFFSSPEIRASVRWGALLKGAVVSDIRVVEPEINFVAGRGPDEQTEPPGDWQGAVEDLLPIRIDSFTVTDGAVHFRDYRGDPPLNIYAQNIDLTVSNITNTAELSGSKIAHVEGSARAVDSGKLELEGDVDPLAERPTFDMNVTLKELKITDLNPLLRRYANLDAEKGRLSMYGEMAADGGKLSGYVKPVVEDLEILDWDEEKGGFFGKLWEGVAGAAAKVLENPQEDQIAARVPIEGSLDDPDIGIWGAIGTTLKNAFIQALFHGLEGSVDIDLAGDGS